MNTRLWPSLAVVLGVLWLFVRGVPPAPVAIIRELVLGLVIGTPLAFGFRRLYADRLDLWRALRAVPYAVLYVAAFLRELLTANVDVARRVLAPSMPLEPDVIVIPLRVETDLAVTTIANSITLTPGTLTMDHDPAENALYVHAIDASDRGSVVEPIRTWEDYALVIFDEAGKPGDPPPSRRGGGGVDADD
ncbi:MAG: Na+/H+ antiporter subunit E [Halobacteriaceae archaeon]